MKTAPRRLVYAIALSLVLGVAAARAQTDYTKIEIKTTKVSGNFYTLEGTGGMIGVLTGPDGVLMVDAQFAPLTEKIVAAIKQISDKPIRLLINTHVHGDHTGGNENLGKMGVTIIARENLRTRLAKPNPGANGAPGTPAPAAALPMITYDAPVTIHMNGEDVQLIPIPSAHTDGDTMVKFPVADVIMSGDFFRSLGYPNIDRANGGSLKGMLDGLDRIVALSGPATKIIPGHGKTVDKAAVAAHRDMIVALRDKVAGMIKQGMTVQQVTAAKPAKEYDAKVPEVGTTDDRFIGQLYAELSAAR
jgi:cyclase